MEKSRTSFQRKDTGRRLRLNDVWVTNPWAILKDFVIVCQVKDCSWKRSLGEDLQNGVAVVGSVDGKSISWAPPRVAAENLERLARAFFKQYPFSERA